MSQILETYDKKKAAIWLTVMIVAIVLIDQALKFWVKLSFPLGSGVDVCGWFQIYFVENKGMAFGLELGSKIFLTSFRILACVAIIYYLYTLIKRGFRRSFVLTVGAVFAGAFGNLIDCIFYGKIFSHSIFQTATLFPANGSYGAWFEGRVVDMLYFPLIHSSDGGVLFFQSVFNFADTAVTVGVFLVIIFFGKDLSRSLETKAEREKREAKERQKEANQQQ